MKLFDRIQVANESIDFQSKSMLGKELENAFTVLYETVNQKKPKEEKVKEVVECYKVFDAIIFKHTGLKIKFLYTDQELAATSFFVINVNNILTSEHFKKHFHPDSAVNMLKQVQEFKKQSYVDLKNAKVHGVFSELEADVYMDLYMLEKDAYTVEQMTAILLHEIGHLFTSFEFLSRQVTTNQVMASCMKSVINKDNIKEREMIFGDALDILEYEESNAAQLAKSDDARVIGTVCIKASIDQLQSELGISCYDQTACEQLADQFASRFGYGRAVIEALDISAKKYFHSSKYPNMRVLINVFEYALLAFEIAMVTVIALMGAGIISLLLATFITSRLFLTRGEQAKGYTYDITKTRYLRVKEDMVQYLKNKDLDPKFVKKTIDDIKIIDGIINETAEARTLFDIIADFINPWNRQKRNSLELQRNLESLAMNDLFVKSAQLATI